MIKALAETVSFRLYMLAQRFAWDRFPDGAFHGDRLNQRVMLELLQRCGVSAFVETGTYKGDVPSFVARHCPGLPIHTIEVDETYYREAAASLAGYASVTVMHGSSSDCLPALLATGSLGTRPMFYLDAHWYADWPLRDELRLITEHAGPAIIVIDDFQVPGHKQFRFDSYGGQACGLDYIRPYLGRGRSHRLALPTYTCRQAFGMSHLERLLRGWVLILQDLDDLFADVVARPGIAGLVASIDVSSGVVSRAAPRRGRVMSFER